MAHAAFVPGNPSAAPAGFVPGNPSAATAAFVPGNPPTRNMDSSENPTFQKLANLAVMDALLKSRKLSDFYQKLIDKEEFDRNEKDTKLPEHHPVSKLSSCPDNIA